MKMNLFKIYKSELIDFINFKSEWLFNIKELKFKLIVYVII